MIGQWVDEDNPATPTLGALLVWCDRLPTLWAELLSELQAYGEARGGPGLSQERHLRRLTGQGAVPRTEGVRR